MVVDHDDGQVAESDRTGVRDRLGVAALLEFSIADQARPPALTAPARAAPAAVPTASGRPCPSEPGRDLDAGHQVAVRVVARAASPTGPNVGSQRPGRSPCAASTA